MNKQETGVQVYNALLKFNQRKNLSEYGVKTTEQLVHISSAVAECQSLCQAIPSLSNVKEFVLQFFTVLAQSKNKRNIRKGIWLENSLESQIFDGTIKDAMLVIEQYFNLAERTGRTKHPELPIVAATIEALVDLPGTGKDLAVIQPKTILDIVIEYPTFFLPGISLYL